MTMRTGTLFMLVFISSAQQSDGHMELAWHFLKEFVSMTVLLYAGHVK